MTLLKRVISMLRQVKDPVTSSIDRCDYCHGLIGEYRCINKTMTNCCDNYNYGINRDPDI